MHRLRLALISLLVLALILGAVACGGGSAGLVDTELALADEVFIGIQNGDFKAVRYNDNGYRDSALNSSMDLAPVDSGDTTTVAIAINDTEPMYGVTLDLHYDPARYSPVEVNFGEMISEPVELAVTRISGLVALGQVDISGEAVRSGEFATVTFAHTPARDEPGHDRRVPAGEAFHRREAGLLVIVVDHIDDDRRFSAILQPNAFGA